MSYAEDEGYAYGFEEYVEDYRLYWTMVWEDLKKKGCVWQDKHGNNLKEKSIDDRYLKRILNFCKTRFRPTEQIEVLNNIAMQRGVKTR